jgi:Na+/H+-dicarboxylate symporter
MTLSTRVLLGLGLGVLTGIVFGELVSFLGVVGRGFVLLLQMTVLPYVAVSLIAGLGSLKPAEARSLARHAGVFLLALWGLALAAVLLMPLAFPGWEAASFFSTSLVEQREGFDFLGLYIPSNPFQSLAEGVVPAVVVFSCAFGLALMGVERKGALVESLLASEDALLEVTNFVVNLAPYGVFAIAAQAAGTMDLEEFRGLQVYGVAYAVAALVLSFWILPVLLTTLTPFRYREVLGPTRDALVTAFATGSVFVVLPILADRSKDLLATREDVAEEVGHVVDVIVPISFTLASAGKLLSLSFVLFAGWLSGFPLSYTQYPGFLVTGTFSFFASTFVAVPFLLDLYRIPSDAFQLFVIADNIVGNRFGAMLAAVHTLTLTLLAACGAAGLIAVRGRSLLRWALLSGVLMLAGLGALRGAFEAVDRPYEGYGLFIERTFLLDPAPSTERSEPPEDLDSKGDRPALERIRQRGLLRVGYGKDQLPFAFRNQAHELVGFDVEMAHALARDLGVRVEFVRIDLDRMQELLDAGYLDIVMSSVAITPERLEQVAFSAPYLEQTLAFIVSDHRLDQFRTRDAVKSLESLKLGVLGSGYYTTKIRKYLPQAEIVMLDSPRAFFTGRSGELDALVYSAEAGSAWTLVYPQFTVAVPHPDVLAVPVGYAVARGDQEMADFVSAWILLRQKDRTVERLFDYWIQGKEPPGRKRRWSVVRDVLGWGSSRASSTPPQESSTTPVETFRTRGIS